MTTTHPTRVKTINGAGQRAHLPICSLCGELAAATTDKETADSIAAAHGVAGVVTR